jgi:hypothetical protein
VSLIGFEGFEDYFSTGTVDQPLGTGQGTSGSAVVGTYWTANAGMNKTAGLLGGSAYAPSSTTQANCFLNANYTRLILGIRFKTLASFAAASGALAFFDGTGTIQCGLSINTSANLFFWRSTPSTVLATGATALTASNWYYLEVDITFSATTGAVTVRLNGSGSEISASALNTAPSGANQCNLISLRDPNSNVVAAFDDLYLLDPTTGSSPFTSMLGPCRVETLFPAANSAVSWTPNASTNVSRVSETNMDSDTTYNATATTGQDIFTHAALSSTPTTIFAAAVKAVIRKDQSSNPTAQSILVSGPTTQGGVTRTQSTSYLSTKDVYLNDPNTGLSWTATAINSSLIGYNRTI